MLQRVRRRDEHHVGQVVLDLDVVIDERVVLLGSSTSSSADDGSPRKSMPILSTSSSRNSGLRTPTLRHVLQDLARHRADIGAAVAADLRLVAHAAERHAHELAIRRARDRLAERRLADAGAPTRHRIGAFSLVDALLHRQVLDDALLDLLQPVVIGVEDLDRGWRGPC